MNLSNETKVALNNVLEKSAGVIGDAIDASGKLVKENAKELVTEVIVFEGYVSNALSIFGSFVLAGLMNKGISYLTALNSQIESERGDMHTNGIVLCYIGLFAALIWFMCALQDVLKAKFAPRLFLVSYAASLLKSNESQKKS